MSTEVKRLHSWDVSRSEAVALQKKLREQVIIQRSVRMVNGIVPVDDGAITMNENSK